LDIHIIEHGFTLDTTRYSMSVGTPFTPGMIPGTVHQYIILFIILGRFIIPTQYIIITLPIMEVLMSHTQIIKRKSGIEGRL
jgi:hypothetical protein